MKTPISYYGGKQKLASTILKLIPDHNLYCEPFLGGAAIFFAKEQSNVEVINDTNKEQLISTELFSRILSRLKRRFKLPSTVVIYSERPQ
jgi:site-specific DNA-adenine methylase